MADPKTPLDAYMTEHGIADAALAGKVGVDRSYITRIRHGERNPSLDVALKLVRETKLPIDSFAKREAA